MLHDIILETRINNTTVVVVVVFFFYIYTYW